MSYKSFYKALVLSRLAKLCEPHEWKYMVAEANERPCY